MKLDALRPPRQCPTDIQIDIEPPTPSGAIDVGTDGQVRCTVADEKSESREQSPPAADSDSLQPVSGNNVCAWEY